MSSRDRAHEGPTDEEWIDEANRRIADRGGKSRYVGTTTEEDWTLDSDVHAADERLGPLDDIPVRDQRRAETAEEQTRAELIRRGLGEKYGLTATSVARIACTVASPVKRTRAETLDKIIHYYASQMGFVKEEQLDEWYELMLTYHPLDKRVNARKDPERLP